MAWVLNVAEDKVGHVLFFQVLARCAEPPVLRFLGSSKILLPSAVHLEERLTVSQAVT